MELFLEHFRGEHFRGEICVYPDVFFKFQFGLLGKPLSKKWCVFFLFQWRFRSLWAMACRLVCWPKAESFPTPRYLYHSKTLLLGSTFFCPTAGWLRFKKAPGGGRCGIDGIESNENRIQSHLRPLGLPFCWGMLCLVSTNEGWQEATSGHLKHTTMSCGPVLKHTFVPWNKREILDKIWYFCHRKLCALEPKIKVSWFSKSSWKTPILGDPFWGEPSYSHGCLLCFLMGLRVDTANVFQNM